MDISVYEQMNMRKFAITVGISLLIMAVAAAFSYQFLSMLVV